MIASVVINQILSNEDKQTKRESIMESKELRAIVVSKFNAKSLEFGALKSGIEAFCVGILIDCKDVLGEINSAKDLFNIIIDEIDDLTNTGTFLYYEGRFLRDAAVLALVDTTLPFATFKVQQLSQ